MSSDSSTPPKSSFRGLGILAVLIVLGAVGAAAAGILSRNRQDKALRDRVENDATPTVSIIAPVAADSKEELVLPSSIQPYYDAPIYARVSGYLKKWNLDIGAQVKAGDVLAEIESPELDQQLQQAKADLATAQVKEKVAETTAKRWQSMVSSTAVSRQEADEKTGDYEAKQAEVNAATANVDRLEALNSFKRVVAPFDGTVTARRTDVGALINAGSGAGLELFHVADTRKLRVYVQVPQTYAEQIHAGMEAKLQLPERAGRSYPAKVVSTAGSINEASRTLLVQLEADNSEGKLFAGSYADVHFDLPGTAGVLQLPVTALMFRQQGLEVALAGPGNKTEMRKVQLGRDFGTKVEVVDGLHPSDRVIDSPPDWLADGDVVRPADSTGETASTSTPATHE